MQLRKEKDTSVLFKWLRLLYLLKDKYIHFKPLCKLSCKQN